ncbi:MAG: AMP-dependent synthetase, partial [Chloroflexota bacterium]
MKRKITIADVAEAAGVSRQTVSRVLNAKGEISAETRERVLDVKQRCGIVAAGLELKIVDDAGKEVPHDGVSMGRLLVRGPWIA